MGAAETGWIRTARRPYDGSRMRSEAPVPLDRSDRVEATHEAGPGGQGLAALSRDSNRSRAQAAQGRPPLGGGRTGEGEEPVRRIGVFEPPGCETGWPFARPSCGERARRDGDRQRSSGARTTSRLRLTEKLADDGSLAVRYRGAEPTAFRNLRDRPIVRVERLRVVGPIHEHRGTLRSVRAQPGLPYQVRFAASVTSKPFDDLEKASPLSVPNLLSHRRDHRRGPGKAVREYARMARTVRIGATGNGAVEIACSARAPSRV